MIGSFEHTPTVEQVRPIQDRLPEIISHAAPTRRTVVGGPGLLEGLATENPNEHPSIIPACCAAKNALIQPPSAARATLEIAELESLRQTGHTLYMSVETGNLLRRFPAYREIILVRNTVEVLEAGRYFKRWAHRLRRHGFTREDAKLLSLGVFGTDVAGETLGVDIIVTFDRPLVNHYRQLTPSLASQLAAMTTNLGMPYTAARPPKVVLPAELWLEQMVKDDRS